MPEVHLRKTPATNEVVPVTRTDPFPVSVTGADGAAAASTSNPLPIAQSGAGQATYTATVSGQAFYATPTDTLFITGSASKIVRVTGFYIAAKSTAAAQLMASITKRSTLNTGGAPSALTAVPHSGGSPAATASVGVYTVAPSPLGTSAGMVRALDSSTTVLAGVGNFLGLWGTTFTPQTTVTFAQPITLNNVNEGLYMNFAAAALPLGFSCVVFVEWTESAT